MDELIKRLRDKARIEREYNSTGALEDEAADTIEELIAKLNHADDQIDLLVEAAEERRWIPVEARLPEIRQVVLITDGIDVGTGWMNQGRWNTPFADIQRNEVTHWMPLPEPPKEG